MISSVPSAKGVEHCIAARKASLYYCDGTRHRPTLRGVMHTVMFLSTPLWARSLLRNCTPTKSTAATLVYMYAWALQYGGSAAYHCVPALLHGRTSVRYEILLANLDHAAIYVMIAGSYTPGAILALKHTGTLFLVCMWSVAAAGACHSFLPRRSGRVKAVMYVCAGCLIVPCIPEMVRTYSKDAIAWQVYCWALYVLGAVVYAYRWPELWPGHFGYHEVFHTLVVCAGVAMYMVNHDLITRTRE